MGIFLRKLKSQKGATGTDVLVSAAMIALAIGIVSMIYLNVSIQTRNITRTAGATRIATNLIENIDIRNYDDFITVVGTGISKEGPNLGGTQVKIFDVNIPTGYKVEITAEPKYGSHTNTSEQFDLVRQVDVKVIYKVGKIEENVNFTTVKKRELFNECNPPVLGDINVPIGAKVYPVKFSNTVNAYIKTIETDPEWYNYSNREWATVIISKKTESDLFDPNGKFKSDIDISNSNNYTQKVVWIPRYFKNKNNNTVEFAYTNSQKNMLKLQELTALDGTSKFSYYKSMEKDTDLKDIDSSDFGDLQTGKWSYITKENKLVTGEVFSSTLNSSQYGPCNLH